MVCNGLTSGVFDQAASSLGTVDLPFYSAVVLQAFWTLPKETT